LAAPAFEFKVTELVRTSIDASVLYESRPAEEVGRLDYTFRDSFALAF
jgi:hypothetical protein